MCWSTSHGLSKRACCFLAKRRPSNVPQCLRWYLVAFQRTLNDVWDSCDIRTAGGFRSKITNPPTLVKGIATSCKRNRIGGTSNGSGFPELLDPTPPYCRREFGEDLGKTSPADQTNHRIGVPRVQLGVRKGMLPTDPSRPRWAQRARGTFPLQSPYAGRFTNTFININT